MADHERSYARVASVADVPRGEARAFTVGSRDVAVFNIDGVFYALENACPHQGGPIADGFLEGPLVTCPWHAWCFDVRTGTMTLGEFARIARFAVHTEHDDLFVSRDPVTES